MAKSNDDTWSGAILLIVIIVIFQICSRDGIEPTVSKTAGTVENSSTSISDTKAKKQEQSESVALAFVNALGRRDFRTAYQLQSIKSWGNFRKFSSNSRFGGVTATKILSSPTVVQCLNKSCTQTKIFVRYLSVDPVNDNCEGGRIFEQLFWVGLQNNNGKITKAELKKDPYCYVE